MCRVRFGLTGIYFDSLEPSRPREEFFHPLNASIPPALHNKPVGAVPEATNCAEIKEEVAIESKKIGHDSPALNLSDSPLSPSRDQNCCLEQKAQTNCVSAGSKRVRNSVSSSSASASPASLPLSSDEDRVSGLVNSENDLQAPQNSKLTNSRATLKRSKKLYRGHTSKSHRGHAKTPPAKRVRFAMDMLGNNTSSHDASGSSCSHSSDDSYTDPPSPAEPYDVFGGYCRTPGASRTHDMNGKIAGWRMGIPAEVKTEIDGYNGFPDSEDGSEVDAQALRVEKRPPRTIQPHAKDQTSNQRYHQNNSTSATWSKRFGRIIDQSPIVAGNHMSNADDGLHLEDFHTSRQRSMSRPQSREPLRYPRLRSGKDLPEPIFVVRPRFLSIVKEKGKPAGKLSNGGYSRDISENGHKGLKIQSHRPTPVKASKKSKIARYRPPSITDNLNTDGEFDEGLVR